MDALIDPITKEWNAPLVRQVFMEEEAKLICNIPLSRHQRKDKLIWGVLSSGLFTVRSAYFLEHERKSKAKGEGSEPKGGEGKTIWKLKVTNPAKVFLWKACSNILPTKDNLQRRGIKMDVLCNFCKREE